jgi:hypothetical protein
MDPQPASPFDLNNANRYLYATSNPVYAADPTGMDFEPIMTGVGAVQAALATPGFRLYRDYFGAFEGTSLLPWAEAAGKVQRVVMNENLVGKADWENGMAVVARLIANRWHGPKADGVNKNHSTVESVLELKGEFGGYPYPSAPDHADPWSEHLKIANNSKHPSQGLYRRFLAAGASLGQDVWLGGAPVVSGLAEGEPYIMRTVDKDTFHKSHPEKFRFLGVIAGNSYFDLVDN